MSSDWRPGEWELVYDPKVPTNRSVDSPYIEGKSFITIIDGFLVSPNVDVMKIKGIDHEFKDSDHNSVIIKLKAR